MKTPIISVREWLVQNNYPEVAAQINEIMGEWKQTGRRTRRNWWDILAGGIDGRPKTVEGRVFPVLRAARQRQGLSDTEGSIRHRKEESPPPIVEQARWAKVAQ
jgi:hypothetical protein